MPTHGSLSKAGKVRTQTAKMQIEGRTRKSKMPRVGLRRKYEKRIILQRNPGQSWKQGDRRRRRRGRRR
ncbi:MAG: 30S ribosomal protein S30e [Candidatus Bathyarchaeota archaeon]|nr:MAG: 30S ribosomal protein S30e [Candidatus Bathyarchaeota archaeon]